MTRLLLISACAASAGIHAALAPGHLAESRTLGLGFVAAAVLLATAALVLALRPSRAAALGAGTLFASLILAYIATRAAEPVDALGVVTKTIESLGLVLAVAAIHGTKRPRANRLVPVALACTVAVLAGAATPAGGHAHAPAAPAHGH